MKNIKINENAAGAMRRFNRDGHGSYTIEFVILMPIFAILLAILLNLSIVFYYETRMLRVAQDATRAYSLGRFTEVQAENYIKEQLSFIQAKIAIDTVQVGGVAQTIVTTTADQLIPFSLAAAPFENVRIGVSTQYTVEN